MRYSTIAGLSMIVLLAGSTIAAAQGSTTGTNSAVPQRGAGVGGAGVPAAGPATNQPGSAAPPNSAATPGPGTQGSPGNVPSGTIGTGPRQ